MEKQPKKWYASWKFVILVILILLLLAWLLLPDEVMASLSGFSR